MAPGTALEFVPKSKWLSPGELAFRRRQEHLLGGSGGPKMQEFREHFRSDVGDNFALEKSTSLGECPIHFQGILNT